jgi:hypothetical protein
MSLFANDQYRWRETYFVLFQEAKRPTAEQLTKTLEGLGAGYQVTEVATGDDGNIDSLTLVSPFDFAAMDISYVGGDEVREQVEELKREFHEAPLTKQGREKLKQLDQCNARFDVYHFEQIVGDDESDEEDEYLDPGSLIVVLKSLVRLCEGVGIDPQAGALM